MKNIQTIPFWRRYEKLLCAFTTKAHGSMSLRSSDRKQIAENREVFMKELGIHWKNVLLLPLSHSNRVLIVRSSDQLKTDADGIYMSGGQVFKTATMPVHINSEWQVGIDGIITDKKDLFPVILSADCAPVALFDHDKGIFAFVHVGLIGAINQIVPIVIECMVREFGSYPQNIEVVIFPSIRKCHYDLKMSQVWKRIKTDVISHAEHSRFVNLDDHFDLQGLILGQLRHAGIPDRNVHDIALCTVCHRDDFFSNFRAGSDESKKREGRFASIVGLKL